MMRHILTWDKGAYVRRPLQAIAEAVAAADRISSALSAEQLAFAEADDWKKLATWNGSRYLRFGNA